MCVFVIVYLCLCMYVNACMYIGLCMSVCVSSKCMFVCVCMHVCVYVCVHMWTDLLGSIHTWLEIPLLRCAHLQRFQHICGGNYSSEVCSSVRYWLTKARWTPLQRCSYAFGGVQTSLNVCMASQSVYLFNIPVYVCIQTHINALRHTYTIMIPLFLVNGAFPPFAIVSTSHCLNMLWEVGIGAYIDMDNYTCAYVFASV